MPTATLSKKQSDSPLQTLKDRFEKHAQRHAGIAWDAVETRLRQKSRALWSLSEMERTGGEPDVIGQDKATGEFIFCDCSATGRHLQQPDSFGDAALPLCSGQPEHAAEGRVLGTRQSLRSQKVGESPTGPGQGPIERIG